MYNNKTRTWGIEGKDIRNVTFGNYFPATFGGNFAFTPSSTVQEYENIEAISVGLGVTYALELSEKSVESCPQKYEIFNAIKIWENARAANAFPPRVKKELQDTSKYFHLEAVNANNWNLYLVNKEGADKRLFARLKRSR